MVLYDCGEVRPGRNAWGKVRKGLHRSGRSRLVLFITMRISIVCSTLFGLFVAALVFAVSGCKGSSGGSSTGTPIVAPTITWATPGAVPAGTTLSSVQLDATSSVAGTFAYTPAAGTVVVVGQQTLKTTFTPTDTTHYSLATATVTLTVTQATPTILWPTPAAVTVGATLGATQLNATASNASAAAVAGSFVYAPAAGTVLSTPGTVTLSATFTPADTADYAAATAKVALAVEAAGSGGAPSYSWSNVQVVGGGYVTGLYFHPTQQNLIYARTDVGGAYRWDATVSAWTPLLDWIPGSKWYWGGVEAIGLDPTNPNQLYLAVGEYALEPTWDGNGAMLVSSDQGNTFTTVPLPFQNGSNDSGRNAGERIAVDPNAPNIVYFGTRVAGLQISTNSGLSWAPVSGMPVTKTANGSGIIAVLPVASSKAGGLTPVVYAAAAGTGTDAQGLYVTTNGGTASSTWTAVAGQPTGLAPLHSLLGPDGAIYILYGDQPGPDAMTTSQLWKYTPGANWTTGTWAQIALPGVGGYGGLAVDPERAGTLLVATLDQYTAPGGDTIFRSTNYGATWRDISSTGGSHDATLAPWVAFHGPVGTGNWATSLVIDPFNSAHALYGTGETIWNTTNLTAADSNQTVDWTIGAQGVEETVVAQLLAPPSGNTLLLSSLYDITGFAHPNLSASPPQQMFQNPQATSSTMDFAQNAPTTVVRVTEGTTPYGSISNDGGLTWSGFGAVPAGTAKGGGEIAIVADGSSIVWSPVDTGSVWYSTNGGANWLAAAGIPAQAQVVSDRRQPGIGYGYAGTSLYLSVNAGATWTVIQSNLPASGRLYALPDVQGSVWLAGSGGLYSNQGTATAPSLGALASVQSAEYLGFGKAAPGSTAALTLYLDGIVSGTQGIYRSTDGGGSWIQINDAAHEYGNPTWITGDMRTFGTVYVGTGGRGIVWGTSTQ